MIIDSLAIYLYCEHLRAQLVPGDDDTPTKLPDGEPVVICTSSANHIAQQFGGIVCGYHVDTRIAGIIGSDEGGHDFCIINDRYIVDFWAWDVDGSALKPVWDLRDSSDELYVNQHYLPRSQWEEVHNYSNSKLLYGTIQI